MVTPYFKSLGFGFGFRPFYYGKFLAGKPPGIDWIEAITENHLAWHDGTYRRSIEHLERARRDFPVTLHGTTMSLGSAEPLSASYLDRLEALVRRIDPAWVSDHLCWGGIHGTSLHDLLPLPYTSESVRVISDKIQQVQERLGRRILVENVSSYVEFEHSEMTEWEFVSEVVKRADCGLLFDVNNIFVSAVNHDFDPYDYVRGIPLERVGQIHLAGHLNVGAYRIDTHDHPVCDEVWELYRWACRELGQVSTLLEWDDKQPEWDVIVAELDKARKVESDERHDAGRAPGKISAVPAPESGRGPARRSPHPTAAPSDSPGTP